ncbi:hypothetical protein CPJCM30710_05940 [Clostridium polyendosporum]|uniref:Dipeptidase E n=1 Tax=Clostridium polyendosporum TaxID=69208 RepID=A0A919RYK2_9CLOT|nr:Type 1 glutamine amidotransferase-like domain-containing protein [Clostridium polyendosporum]GIM27928.1 hypothetical protein CPJCM30710_05940 [Clostridium polyendosporum]
MKLFLLSKLNSHREDSVNKLLLSTIGKKGAQVGYISFNSDSMRKVFNSNMFFYRGLGLSNILYFDLEEEFNSTITDNILNCDAIYLCSDDTNKLLYLLKKRNMNKILKRYVSQGGILVGVSAGGILMTEDIAIASLIVGEEPPVKDATFLSLVDFTFIPHWQENTQYLPMLIDYSLQHRKKIYCCSDGYGIAVIDNKIEFFGDIVKIHEGNISIYKGNYKVF